MIKLIIKWVIVIAVFIGGIWGGIELGGYLVNMIIDGTPLHLSEWVMLARVCLWVCFIGLFGGLLFGLIFMFTWFTGVLLFWDE